jgi:hypothetical protein
VVDNKSQVTYIKQHSQDLPIHVLPIGALSKKLEGKDLAEMIDMHSNGAVAFSDGLYPVQSTLLFLKALQYVKAFDGVVIQMPIDKSLGSLGLMNEGILSTKLGLVLRNEATSGASNQTIFHSFISHMDSIQSEDIIIIGWSHVQRFRVSELSNRFCDIKISDKVPKYLEGIFEQDALNQFIVNRDTNDIFFTEVIDKLIEVFTNLRDRVPQAVVVGRFPALIAAATEATRLRAEADIDAIEVKITAAKGAEADLGAALTDFDGVLTANQTILLMMDHFVKTAAIFASGGVSLGILKYDQNRKLLYTSDDFAKILIDELEEDYPDFIFVEL